MNSSSAANAGFPAEAGSGLSQDVFLVFGDIPFLAVGVMAFGVFTFAIVAKRVNLAATYLYSSALFAFAAALLDLAQILARARATTSSVTSTVIARELCLSAFIGLRYLFFWAYVGQCPQAEQSPNEEQEHPEHHSARWTRWGLFGSLLQWITLALVFAIFVLEILWRLIPQLNNYSAVYMASSTAQLIASATWAMKLAMNIYLSPFRLRVFRAYISVYIALCFGFAISIIDLLQFAFSNTTLGRFLQALQTYILILNLLIGTFSVKLAGGLPLSPVIPAATIIEKVSGNVPTSRPRYATRFSHISSIRTRRQSRRGSGGERLWDEHDAERGMIPASLNSPGTENNALQRVESIGGNPQVAFALTPSGGTFEASRPTIPMSQEKIRADSPVGVADTLRPTTAFSFASYYMSEQTTKTSRPPPRDVDSPIYGLNGILPRRNEDVNYEVKPTTSMSSFDELLRQQKDLDDSIQTLRIFSTAALALPAKDSVPMDRGTSLDSIPGNRRTDSAARSDFSLSIFPEPPVGFDMVAPPPARNPGAELATSTQGRIRGDDGDTYNVTSFVAELTASNPTALVEGDAEQDNNPASRLPITSSMDNSLIGPALPSVLDTAFVSSSPASSTFGPATASSGLLTSRESRLKPLLLVPDYPSKNGVKPVKRSAKKDIRMQRGIKRIGLPTRPAMKISGPRPFTPEQPLRLNAFEQPRRPPNPSTGV